MVMMKYRETTHLDLTSIDKEILAFWKDQKIFEKSVEHRTGQESYVFYEGPPSANGKPGIHHVMARTIKDLYCRYHTMLGKRVERKGGWDTHGLPIELSVEKELGITKEDIGTKISVAEYNAQCRKTVMRYKDLWDDLTIKMGYWVDLDHPYITFDNEYIETEWYLLKQLYDRGLLYKGYTIQPYSPAAGTGLSSHELNMPGAYKEVKDLSVVAQFLVKKDEKSNRLIQQLPSSELFILAWTTTPWTLPSNTALAVGRKIEYVVVSTFNPYTQLPVQLLLAKDLVSKWFKDEQFKESLESYKPGDQVIPAQVILDGLTGTDLEGLNYHQLLPFVQPQGNAFRVLIGDFVSTEDGTGIVHLAPSFGGDDLRVAKQHGIAALTLVDEQGKFTDDAGEFAGRYVKDYKNEDDYVAPDIDIAVALKKSNRAFNVQKYLHNYPHCWRTDKPVIYYPLDSWFIKSTAKKERMSELNRTINWKPEHTGTKRFGNWLDNLQDWNLSRSRFWGTPLPIWRTADGNHEKCIGSMQELQIEIDRANEILNLSQTLPQDLHRPYIDEITLASDHGEPMTREPDLIDVWFDSGSMPYAQWHYPFENQEKFKTNFPADFIAEGVDQTRGWFFTLHAIAVMVSDSVAFRNVVSNGLIQDKEGRKMSKRLGNAVDPFETMATYGADATRWYLITNSQPWDNLKFDIAGVDEVRRKFFGTLYNTYSFYALYANVDQFSYQQDTIPLDQRPEIDQWIISKLHSTIASVRSYYESYDATPACRLIQSFVETHLSNWYVRLCRRRFWKGQISPDKIAAYQTLYDCMIAVAQMMAPVAPFFSEWLFANLNEVTQRNAAISVHISDFPVSDPNCIDLELEQRMDYAQRISSLALSLRKKEKIRVRQPLQKILLPILNAGFQEQIERVRNLILSEINVKDIEYITDTSGILKKAIKPNYKTLGKRLGKNMKSAAAIIDSLTQEDISEIEQSGQFQLTIGETDYVLSSDDFIIGSEDIPGWQVASDGDFTVALDIKLTDQLIAEGTARELVNRIQNLRKGADLEVTDRISVMIKPNQFIAPALDLFTDYIKNEVLADELVMVDFDTTVEKIDLIDNESVEILLEKVH